MTRFWLALLTVVSLGVAQAHAHLSASTPAQDGVVAAAEVPGSITLEFTEGVELAFSTFKLVRVEHELEVATDTYAMRLNALVAPLVAPLLDARGVVEGQLVFTMEPASGQADRFELLTLEPLTPGSYLLAWRALSADSHVVEGYLVFTVVP